jgi:hypothetical protein
MLALYPIKPNRRISMKRSIVLGLLLLLAVVVTACSGANDSTVASKDEAVVEAMSEEESKDDAMMDESDDDTMEDASDDDMMKDDSDDMMKDESDDDMMKDDSDDMMKDESDDDMMKDESHDDMKDESNDDMMKDESDDDMMKDESDDGMMEESAMTGPDWFSVQLTDVNSGTSFSVSDHQGKVILVETIAVWCSNCLRQQREVQTLHQALGERDDFVSLALDIDTRETAEILQAHAAGNGFDWLYAVAPPEVAREIGQLYGDQFLSPPSTPMLIIDRHGEVHPLPFGVKSAEDLQTALEPFLSDSM